MARKPTPEDALLADAARRLKLFIPLVSRTDDGEQALPPRHIKEIVIPAIEDDSLGDTVIVAPPGSIKTNTLMAYLSHYIGNHPTEHVAYVCASGPMAEQRSLAIRDTVEFNGWYQKIFPGVVPNKVRGWAADAWYLKRPNVLDKNPTFTAVGVGGRLRGARLHRIVYDDLSDDENTNSDGERMKVWRFLAETGKTRLHPTKGRQIMIGTREHEDDAVGYALDRGWHAIRIPAITSAGESYWPEYVSLASLACPNNEHNPVGQCCMKKELGALGFARQFMCTVENEETSLFKRSWWAEYDVPEKGHGCITVDTAGWDNTKDHGDFTAIGAGTSGSSEGPFHIDIREVINERLSFIDTMRTLRDLRVDFPLPIVVEDVPWARPLIQALREELHWGIIAWPVQGRSKYNRAKAVSPLVEDGTIRLPRQARWKGAFIDQLALYDNGKYDDMVDMAVMMGSYLNRTKPRSKKIGKPWSRSMEQVSA